MDIEVKISLKLPNYFHQEKLVYYGIRIIAILSKVKVKLLLVQEDP